MIKSASQTGAKPIVSAKPAGPTSHRLDLDLYTPENVIDCNTVGDLEALLQFYGRTPFIQKVTVDSIAARRYYVEKIRPALRWYCAHFGVPVPRWLRDSTLPDWSGEEKKLLFGDEPLVVTEFERRETPAPVEMQPQGGAK